MWLRRHPLRGVDSVHLQMLLTGTCRQCGSSSVTGHDHICVSKLARHGPWPVRKRLIRDHAWRGRSKPGCRIASEHPQHSSDEPDELSHRLWSWRQHHKHRRGYNNNNYWLCTKTTDLSTCRARHDPSSDMELGHWVTGSMGRLGHLSRPGHRVIIWTRCETWVFFRFSKKCPKCKTYIWNAEMTKVIVRCLLLDWNHWMSVYAMNFYFYLWLLKILRPENTSSHISRHLEFIIWSSLWPRKCS